MNVTLVVEQGARRRAMTIRAEEAIVGRGRGNAVRIPSAEVSRQHCRLSIEGGLVQVEDLGSVNGTFVNGRKLRRAEYLRPGDQLGVGPVTFLVEYELSADALSRLRREDDPADMLELLADGEVVFEMEVASEEELPVLEMFEEPDEVESVATFEADELSPIGAGDDDALLPDLETDDAGWQLPDGDFRDMLSQLKDDPRKPKRR